MQNSCGRISRPVRRKAWAQEVILTENRVGEYAFDFAVVVFGVRLLASHVLQQPLRLNASWQRSASFERQRGDH